MVGFNARFTQNTPGQENLLSASAAQIASGAVAAPVVEGAAPIKEGAAPIKEEATPAISSALPVKTPHVVVEEAPPAAPVHASIPPILVPAAPAHTSAAPVHVVAPAPAPVHTVAPVATHPSIVVSSTLFIPTHLKAYTNIFLQAGAHVIGGGKITPEMAKLIKEQTGIDVPVSARKSRMFRA